VPKLDEHGERVRERKEEVGHLVAMSVPCSIVMFTTSR